MDNTPSTQPGKISGGKPKMKTPPMPSKKKRPLMRTPPMPPKKKGW
jgi:hypothetical protein